jgi:tRNA dimethylallyltransferase
MDIGTAKPSPQVRRAVAYHLLDLVDPSEQFSVRQFQEAARAALDQIRSRRHRALLVGGTGLYLRAVVDDLELPGRWPAVAAELDAEADRGGLDSLYARLVQLDPAAAARIEPGNRRRLVRALEVTLGSGRPFSTFGPGLEVYPPTPVVLVGIRFDPALHDGRIERRFQALIEAGLLDEVRRLSARPGGMSRTARQALGYRELLTHIEDGVPLDQALAAAVARTRAFARRQWSWFKRDPRIHWLDPESDPLTGLIAHWDGGADPALRMGDCSP